MITMKLKLIYCLLLPLVLLLACNNNEKTENTAHLNASVFPRGEIITNDNFTGTAYLQMLINPDSIYQTSIGNVTFEPGARTRWHQHPGGQILLVTAGSGYYHAKGMPAQAIRKGDVIRIAPDLEHWHGASPDSSLTHIAISLNLDKGGVVWLQPVSEEEYEKETVKSD
jgi:quercetin dioxygenase-like cupin family protein